MIGYLDKALLRFARKKGGGNPLRGPLLIELLEASDSELVESYPNGLFRCDIRRKVDDGASTHLYDVVPLIGSENLEMLRAAVSNIAEELSPDQVDPLTFTRLIEVLSQMAARELSR